MSKENSTPEHVPESGIDWQEMRNRLDGAATVLAQDAQPSPEARRSILKERARALAHDQDSASEAGEMLDVILFQLAAETYAIESVFVREVYPLRDFTTLPGLPAFVLGIVNVRGQIVSVVNLKTFFGLPDRGLGELNKLIIIRNDGMEFGILADLMLGTVSIPVESIQPPLPGISDIGAAYLRGVTAERVVILDGDRILRDESIVINYEGEPGT
jgi:purine-binding chemotaxis protein CheW